MEETNAINNNLVTFSDRLCQKININEKKDVLNVLIEQRDVLCEKLGEQLNRLRAVKWYIAVVVKFIKTINNEEISTTPTFHGKTHALLQSDEIIDQYDDSVNKIMESVGKYIRDGSGWTLDTVLRLDLCIVKYQPLYASSYIPTPKDIAHPTKGIVNIKNTYDNKCFLYCILEHIKPDLNRHHKVGYYKKHENLINMTGINYPVKLDDIDEFENLNPTISTNVFGYENKEVVPLRVTSHKKRMHHVNLLYVTNTEGNSHYCLITSLSRLLSNLTKHKDRSHYCNYCLKRFRSQHILDVHNCNLPEVPKLPESTKNCNYSYLPTPKKLSKNVKGIVNIQNKKN